MLVYWYSTVRILFSFETNLNPMLWAALTRATSSGEGPSNYPLELGMHSWQVAIIVNISSISCLLALLSASPYRLAPDRS